MEASLTGRGQRQRQERSQNRQLPILVFLLVPVIISILVTLAVTSFMPLDSYKSLQIQLIQIQNMTDDGDPTSNENLTDTETLRHASIFYLSMFAVLFLLFLLLRPFFPRAYNLKKTYPALYAPVADNAFGYVNWMWKVFSVESNDIRDQCGMDALTTIRIFQMGIKLSLVGVVNSIYLMPIYSSGGNGFFNNPDHPQYYDPVKGVSLSNLQQKSHAAIATTFAAYTFFLSFLHWIDKDFEWFTKHRHAFLSMKRVPNYSIFLSGLPVEMQSSTAITEYFSSCFEGANVVVDVNVALVIPDLEKKVAKRDALVSKLEHANNILKVKKATPTHRSKIFGGAKVESVPTYTREIEDLNKDIEQDIARIHTLQHKREAAKSGAARRDDFTEIAGGDGEMQAPLIASGTHDTLPESNGDGEPENHKEMAPIFDLQPLASSVSDVVLSSAAVIKTLITGEEGKPRNAAFISLANLTSTNLARQAIHNEEPWCCVPVEPPMPDYVNWKNVGKSNANKQIGELISLALTTVLCIFWTIPVAFVASLSNVEALTELLPFLKAPVENYEWFSALLALLAPLLLTSFVALLPYVILFIIKFEGLIEIETMQHPSLFSKVAAFTIIQTFFISTFASTLFSSLQEILKTPKEAIKIVAERLPAQSAFFMQLIVVQNLLSLGMELLRISPIAINGARIILSNVLGYNLTDEERSKSFLGLNSLGDPKYFYFGRELGSKTILLQMVLYVYGCMAPLTCYFTLLVFGMLAVGYRHQFLYVYPIANDSGGQLWINFQRISIICAIVAQIVLSGVLFLKESNIAAALMIPLIIITILFHLYFKRRHYATTSFLPLGVCAAVDHKNINEGMGPDWLKDAYNQPALKNKVILPGI